MLASVVSDGSPGSSLLIAAAEAGMPLCVPVLMVESPVRVRARFTAGALVDAASGKAENFFCVPSEVSATVESSPSSPDASREDGCMKSAVDDFGGLAARWVELRLRLLRLLEDAEDIFVAFRRANYSISRPF